MAPEDAVPGDIALPPPLAAELVEQALGQLSADDAAVLRLRFGIGGRPPHTVAEVATLLGMACERVQRIELAALRALRLPGGGAAALRPLRRH